MLVSSLLGLVDLGAKALRGTDGIDGIVPNETVVLLGIFAVPPRFLIPVFFGPADFVRSSYGSRPVAVGSFRIRNQRV